MHERTYMHTYVCAFCACPCESPCEHVRSHKAADGHACTQATYVCGHDPKEIQAELGPAPPGAEYTDITDTFLAEPAPVDTTVTPPAARPCAYVRTYACMHVHTYVRTYACAQVDCVRIYVRTYCIVHRHVHTYACMCIRTKMHTCSCAVCVACRVPRYVRTYARTYVRTHTKMCKLGVVRAWKKAKFEFPKASCIDCASEDLLRTAAVRTYARTHFARMRVPRSHR